MSNIQVVGLGMATLDILIRISEAADLGPWPALQRDGDRWRRSGGDSHRGGGARWASAPGFVGTCGSDRLAEIKLQTLTECGVDVSRMAPPRCAGK